MMIMMITRMIMIMVMGIIGMVILHDKRNEMKSNK